MHIVKYTVQPDLVADNERLVRAVFDELRRARPPGLRYACLRQPGPGTFIHIVANDAGNAARLTDYATFNAFSASIDARCEVLPQRIDVELIGNHELLAHG